MVSPVGASSSTAAKSLRSVLASKLGAAMSFLTPHSSLKQPLTFSTNYAKIKL